VPPQWTSIKTCNCFILIQVLTKYVDQYLCLGEQENCIDVSGNQIGRPKIVHSCFEINNYNYASSMKIFVSPDLALVKIGNCFNNYSCTVEEQDS
jgi:hypothetical protein